MKILSQELIFNINNPPAPSCHASTVAFHEGRFYAAWFGGTDEGANDVGIWISNKEKDREVWNAPIVISSSQNIPHWNPVLFSFKEKLFLYYKKGFSIPEWQTHFKVFESGYWSGEKELVLGDKRGRGPVKNKPIKLENGLILAPASSESGTEPPAGTNMWNAFVDVSTDCINWKAQTLIPADVNLIQPAFWESVDGVHALMRSDAGSVYRSDSIDGGLIWNRAYKTDLPNNNSGIDAVYAGGCLYVVYNPIADNWGARTPLLVAKSVDNGITWHETLTLEDSKGEYSYPSIIEADGFLHIVYTYQRRGIMYTKMGIDK